MAEHLKPHDLWAIQISWLSVQESGRVPEAVGPVGHSNAWIIIWPRLWQSSWGLTICGPSKFVTKNVAEHLRHYDLWAIRIQKWFSNQASGRAHEALRHVGHPNSWMIFWPRLAALSDQECGRAPETLQYVGRPNFWMIIWPRMWQSTGYLTICGPSKFMNNCLIKTVAYQGFREVLFKSDHRTHSPKIFFNFMLFSPPLPML